MIVESMDHRKPRLHVQQSSAKEPECVRVVLQPTAESLYADLCLLNAKSGSTWTDQEALAVESKILVRLAQTCPSPRSPRPAERDMSAPLSRPGREPHAHRQHRHPGVDAVRLGRAQAQAAARARGGRERQGEACQALVPVHASTQREAVVASVSSLFFQWQRD